MDELKKLLDSLRGILDDADLEDEIKERGEKDLQAVEAAFEEEAKREIAPVEEVTPEEAQEVVDLTPMVEKLTEAITELAAGQREIVESLQAKPVEEVVEEPEESREVEVEEEVTPEPDLNEKRYTKLEGMIADLTKTVKDSVPVRRGKGPEEKEPELNEFDKVMTAVEAMDNPETRLRSMVGHITGDRPIEV